MRFLILIISAYLLGSISFGLIIAKAHGKDLRSIGSGNIGATNLARALGRKWAYFCFVLDVAKGLVPMLIATLFYSSAPSITELFLWLAVGIAAVLGHIFPIYAKFKGGKGVATSFGVALGLWPYYTICALFAIAIWAVVVLLWRYVSLASITASIAFPITLLLAIVLAPSWDFANLWPLLIVATAIPLMVIVRQRDIPPQQNLYQPIYYFNRNEQCPLISDINNDGMVELNDFAILANYWLMEAESTDLNDDNIVDFNDLDILTDDWLKTIMWP